MSVSIKSNLLKNLFKNVYFINGTAYAGKSTMVKLLAEKYDGIFCGSDHLAYHTCEKLRELGVRIPEQVQIIGYDGLQLFGFEEEDYYCSTIAQPIKQMAETAVDLLLNPDRSRLPALVCLPVEYKKGSTTRDGGDGFGQ